MSCTSRSMLSKRAVCIQARLMSLSSRITETVTFFNSAGHDAVVLWLNFSGDEVRD